MPETLLDTSKERLLEAAIARPNRALDQGRSSPTADKNLGYIFVDEVYPMGQGEIKLGDEISFSNPRDLEELSDEDLAKLAADIEENEQLAPIWVRPVRRGWELIAGERRLIAHRFAKKTKILARVFYVDAQTAMEMAIREETHSKKWSSVAQARAYTVLRQMMQEHVNEAWALREATGKTSRGDEKMLDADWERLYAKVNAQIESKKLKPWVLEILQKTQRTPRLTEPVVSAADMVSRVGAGQRTIEGLLNVAVMDPEAQKIAAENKLSGEKTIAIAGLVSKADQRSLVKEAVEKNLDAGAVLRRVKELNGKPSRGGLFGGRFNKTGKAKFSSFEQEREIMAQIFAGDMPGLEPKRDPIGVQDNIQRARAYVSASATALMLEGDEDPSWTRPAKDATITQLERLETFIAEFKKELKKKGKFG